MLSSKTRLIFISILFFTFVCSESENLFLETLKEAKKDVNELIAPGNREEFNQQYEEAIDYFQGLNFEKFYSDLGSGKHDNQSCQLCNQAIIYGKAIVKSSQMIRVWSKLFCQKSNYYTQRVCLGILDLLADPSVYIVQNTKLSSSEICSVLLHPDCMIHLNQTMTKNVIWELPLPQRKQFKPLTSNLKPLKMLHLSDFHLDLWYTCGSNALCNEPVCCRSTSYGNNRSAGFWSETEYSCDTPQIFIDTAVRQIADRHKDIDFVIWTGDNSPHDMWNTSQGVELQHILTATQIVKTSFKTIPVFPSLGNHDTHPSNLYIPSNVPKESNFSMSWLYHSLSDYWSQWINTESAKLTFKKGGYYSALVNKGLKVIVLNDGIGDKRSYWIAYTPIDPDGQLEWLIQELDECENNGRYAIIIGHYPPSSCYLSWANNYFRIVERYQEVITGTYFGHTHNDEIIVYYNKNMTTNQTYPISVGYIAPSITTYPYYNPGYRVFNLDKSGKPLDFSSYYTDIINDNKRGAKVEPEWKLSYSAKESYGLADMSIDSWDQFITRAETDDTLTENYGNHYHRYCQTFIKYNQNFTVEDKRRLILNQRVINPIYNLLRN